MSITSGNHQGQDPLDQALNSLPRDVHPTRDLWAGISASIESSAPLAPSFPSLSSRPWLRLAAGFALIVTSSIITYVITQQSAQEQILQARQAAQTQLRQAPPVQVSQVSFGGRDLGAEYMRARTALDAEFQRQIATLPPVTRARLERNLADLRRAASEISATLAEHPSHPLLQELLLSTYQSELALLGSVTNLSVPTLGQSSTETRL